MSSPGGVEVGRVSVRVVPDTSRFDKQAKKEINDATRNLKATIDLVLDSSSINEEVKKAQSKGNGKKIKMDVDVDGDGVARESRRIKQIAQKVVGAIKFTVGLNIPGSWTRIKAELKVIQKLVQGYNFRIPFEFVGVGKWLGILGLVSGVLLTIPHLIGAIGGAANVAAGALALLPAAAAAAAFGIGALVVGMKGFFSALGQSGDPAKFEEALKSLTPAAQASARALATFKEPLSEIRKAVQENLFKGMEKPFLSLKKLLPPIKEGLVGSAGGIRDMAKAWITMATSQKSIKDTGTISSNVTKMFEAMKPAAANFGQAMRDITVVGSTFLPALGKAVSNVTGKFAAWATKVRDSGRLEEIIQNTVDKMKQFGRVVADVVVGLQNIFKATSGGREFLDIIESITQGFRDWSEAKQTQETLSRLANVMRVIGEAAREVFGQIFKTAGEILKDLDPFVLSLARGLGSVLAGAVRLVGSLLKPLARFLSDNKAIMVPLIITIMAGVTAFKLFATVINKIIAIKEAWLALKAGTKLVGEMAGNMIANLKKLISTIVATTVKWSQETAKWIAAQTRAAASSISTAAASARAWIVNTTKMAATATKKFVAMAASATANAVKSSAAWVASAVRSAAFTARYFIIMAAQATAQFAKMAAAAALNAGKVLLTWIISMVRMVATTAAQMAIMIAVWVANWVRMAAVAMANAARIAIAWLIAMGPIALIIIAIIALVALIILNWDTIKDVTTKVWNAIWKLISDIITVIVDAFWWCIDGIVSIWNKLSALPAKIWKWMGEAADKVGNVIGKIIDFFKALPGKIWDAIKNAGGAILDAGKWIIEGIVNGLEDAAGAVWDFIKGICDDIWQGIKDFFGIGSPSRLMMQLGKWINEGWVIGLKANASRVSDQAMAVTNSVLDAFVPIKDIGGEWADSITASTPEALASVQKLMDATSDRAAAEWTGQIKADELAPLEDRVLAALAIGLRVELDGQKVTKSVNANNNMNQRRK